MRARLPRIGRNVPPDIGAADPGGVLEPPEALLRLLG